MLYYNLYVMTPKSRIVNFRPDDDLFDAMERLKERHGTPFSEQVRRALRAWLEQQGVLEKSRGKRAVTRKPR
jgi:hypothetical protein